MPARVFVGNNPNDRHGYQNNLKLKEKNNAMTLRAANKDAKG
jgi:hypothetical protein